MKKIKAITIITLLTIVLHPVSFSQQGAYRGSINRSDGNNINFNLTWKLEKGKQVWYIANAAEKIKVDNITKVADSFVVEMPVFESQFRFVARGGKLEGNWLKRGAVKTQMLPFMAERSTSRFVATEPAAANINGRWAVHFSSDTNNISVAEFSQKGNLLTGTFLNPTGDYRYLEGVVTKDSLLLSGFDGGHAFLFKAMIKSNNEITDGIFYSGGSYKEAWSAVKGANAKVPEESVKMFTRPGEESLNFSFKDLSGKKVSINDDRYKNKVVVIQLMGSWCPNCMDETAFLSEYYNSNKQRGVEVIALAYEYTTDWERSLKSLQKFQQRFNVQYAILNTGVTVGDSLRTEKTLPQVTPIKFFPSSIIIDKKGKIRKFDTGFNGPGTGEHFITYRKEFEETINKLLGEN